VSNDLKKLISGNRFVVSSKRIIIDVGI
jgi:hypothetical protein